jgi:DNA invertase Pin-like site-specific DNA recombinase
MKVAICARTCTHNGQNPEMQLTELQEYCKRRAWEITREYVDVGISGTKEKRPQLDQLSADAKHRHFDALVVWRFDRFARSVSHRLPAGRQQFDPSYLHRVAHMFLSVDLSPFGT